MSPPADDAPLPILAPVADALVVRANARRLVEWLHAHVAEPGTRVLKGRGREWASDRPFLH